MKKFLRRIAPLMWLIKKYRLMKFSSCDRYKSFKATKGGRLIYLSEIDHGNLGDHAIIYSIHNLLGEKEKEMPVFSFARKECVAAVKKIAEFSNKDDIIVIPGGGWIGTLWKESGNLFTEMIELFSKSHIIVFPQTISFDSSDYSARQKKRLYNAISKCKNIDLFVREKESYDFLLNEMPPQNDKIKYGLYPDMVLYINPGIETERGKNVLCVLRRDKEKLSNDNVVDEIKTYLSSQGYGISYSDTVCPYHISIESREKELLAKWKEFAGASLVITDRLHGMIFSIINHTPCIAMDNSNHKISRVFDCWLKDIRGVRVVSSTNEAINAFNDLMNEEVSDVSALNQYFEEMKERITNG